MRGRAAMAVAVALPLLAGEAGCRGADPAPPDLPPGAMRSVEEETAAQHEGQRFSMPLRTVEAPSPALLARLRAATTVNIDATGLTPAARDAFRQGPLVLQPRGEGVLLAASEPLATWSFDGHEPRTVSPTAVGGWCFDAKALAAGVHEVTVKKEGFFPVTTQVLVRPDTYEVVAVRLGKVVSRSGGFAK